MEALHLVYKIYEQVVHMVGVGSISLPHFREYLVSLVKCFIDLMIIFYIFQVHAQEPPIDAPINSKFALLR